MTIIRVTKDDFEAITLVTTPNRYYASSSLGVTGSVRVFPRQSVSEKDKDLSFLFNDSRASAAVDSSFDDRLKKLNDVSRSKRVFRQSISQEAKNYLDLVDSTAVKATDILDIERFTPTTRYTKYTARKLHIKDSMMPYYRVEYPTAHWAYSNYNTLNFFTTFSSSVGGNVQLVPTASVLLYPNVAQSGAPKHEGYVSGSYCLSGAFSFDFYINPRYKKDGLEANQFKAGTIFHLSSSYAVSLVTGSQKDENGLPTGFRIQLQLSHSADFAPSVAKPGLYPKDLVFLSDDNSLLYNNWHHVIIRWGTNLINEGTGSFVIDGRDRGKFVVPSGTISPKPFTNSLNPDVLCIGNFYEGKNVGVNAQSLFFSAKNASRDGVIKITDEEPPPSYFEPVNYKFNHPLKAEVHDLLIRRYYLSDNEVEGTGSRGIGIGATSQKNIAFYLPPFFIQNSPLRRYVSDRGGVYQTPFFTIDATTSDPFNVAMSFGVNGHLINLENYTKDFNTGRYPRLLNLTGSTIDYTTAAEEANTFIYRNPQNVKRNLTILPCDDGNFDPNYEILKYELRRDMYKASGGVTDYSYVNLEQMLSPAAALDAAGLGQIDPDSTPANEYLNELIGMSPENPGGRPGTAYKNAIGKITSSIANEDFLEGIEKDVPLTIFSRTLDASSNQVTMFNISNLYYGRRIQPGTFMIRDVDMSGSYGAVKMTLRDDSMGNLYRADALTPHHNRSSVGNIFYDEGVVLIKNPHLYFFGKNQYEMSFKGINNVYATKYEIVASSGLLNSSSNITYMRNEANLKPSGNVNDSDKFVYVSGINFHDENMNVVAKAKLAQPIIKREVDKILFKVAFDW